MADPANWLNVEPLECRFPQQLSPLFPALTGTGGDGGTNHQSGSGVELPDGRVLYAWGSESSGLPTIYVGYSPDVATFVSHHDSIEEATRRPLIQVNDGTKGRAAASVGFGPDGALWLLGWFWFSYGGYSLYGGVSGAPTDEVADAGSTFAYRSTDLGATWAIASTFPAGHYIPSNNTAFGDDQAGGLIVEASPGLWTVVHAHVSSYFQARTEGTGVYTSSDGGASWSLVETNSSIRHGTCSRRMAWRDDGGLVHFHGRGNTIGQTASWQRSYDGGASWETWQTHGASTGRPVSNHLAVSSRQSGGQLWWIDEFGRVDTGTNGVNYPLWDAGQWEDQGDVLAATAGGGPVLYRAGGFVIANWPDRIVPLPSGGWRVDVIAGQ